MKNGFFFGETGTTWSCRNRRRHSTPNHACQRGPFEPCRTEAEADERITRFDYHEEPGVSQTDRRLGNVGAVYAPRVLHRGRGPNHCARAQRREDFHPRHQ